MRSLLFVPGDSAGKLAKSIRSGADALILDLEDSVAASGKGAARLSTLAFLREHAAASDRPVLFVRVNDLRSGLCESDLDAVMSGPPDGIVLPKAEGGRDIALLDARLAVREALHGLREEGTRILAIAAETPASLFALQSYPEASARLAGLVWGAEDLAAATGATGNHDAGDWTSPFHLARDLCLFAAAAAGVPAVDTVHRDFRDLAALRRQCVAAARDGFSGKLAIHPDQIPVINEAFAPSPEQIAHAERVMAAFAAAEGAGVASLDGAMIDRPHLLAAQRLLARVR